MENYKIEYLNAYGINPKGILTTEIDGITYYNAKQVNRKIMLKKLIPMLTGLAIFIGLFTFGYFLSEISNAFLFALVITYLMMGNNGSTKGK